MLSTLRNQAKRTNSRQYQIRQIYNRPRRKPHRHNYNNARKNTHDIP